MGMKTGGAGRGIGWSGDTRTGRIRDKCWEAKTVRMRTLVECTLTKGVPSGHAFTLA